MFKGPAAVTHRTCLASRWSWTRKYKKTLTQTFNVKCIKGKTYAAHNFVSCFSIKPVHAKPYAVIQKVFLVLYNILIEGLRLFTGSFYLNNLILAFYSMYKCWKYFGTYFYSLRFNLICNIKGRCPWNNPIRVFLSKSISILMCIIDGKNDVSPIFISFAHRVCMLTSLWSFDFDT